MTTVPPPPRKRAKRKKAIAVLARGERVQQTPFGTFMAVWNKKGQPRLRKCFGTIEEAKEWLEQRKTEGAPPPLTAAQYASAQTAIALLPHGVTLAEAARAFLALSRRQPGAGQGSVAAVRLLDALGRFLEARKKTTSDVTWKVYERTVRAFADSQGGDPLLAAVTVAQISSWVADMNPSARNKALRNLSPLFGWAVKHGMVDRNPCEQVDRARGIEPPKGVLSVEDAARLLHGAAERDKRLVPYLAIGLFAGVRPAELARMGPQHLSAGFVRLDASITKAARARTISIRPNLRAWLDAFPPAFPLIDGNLRHHLADLHHALGVPWPADCLRHSFGTYAYELTRDATLVASEMGHQGTGVFFRHYRALADPGDGARFFDIRP